MAPNETRLTSLAHRGGCGCKLSPSVLRELLAGVPQAAPVAGLLVGTETGDDAAVFQLAGDLALVATTDFFTPIVDDPFDFGRIAATNALSDVYAMGGKPIMALAILGMPLGRIDTATVQRILAGGAAVCEAAGIPVAGGHSIDCAEPIYGLVALGTVHPGRVLRNSGARDGDMLILTKALGIGIFSAALKQGRLGEAAYTLMLHSTTQLNDVGTDLAGMDGVHAVTDVTGFGLLGHALEMCRGCGLGARIRIRDVPVLEGAAALAEAGFVTGASGRNWASCAAEVSLPADVSDVSRALLCDPQTSGGLLIAVAADHASAVLSLVQARGFGRAAVIGSMISGDVKAVLF
jgi:selenide,water dikinase